MLTYDQHDGLLVALLAAKHRIEFLSRSLRVVGSAPVPKSLLAGAGGFSLAIGPAGRLFIHRDGQPTVVTAAPAAQVGKLSFSTIKLHGAPHPRGLAVDDRGHLFVSSDSRLVEWLPNGEPVKHSYFTGMPAPGTLRVSRSFSNEPSNVRFQ